MLPGRCAAFILFNLPALSLVCGSQQAAPQCTESAAEKNVPQDVPTATDCAGVNCNAQYSDIMQCTQDGNILETPVSGYALFQSFRKAFKSVLTEESAAPSGQHEEGRLPHGMLRLPLILCFSGLLSWAAVLSIRLWPSSSAGASEQRNGEFVSAWQRRCIQSTLCLRVFVSSVYFNSIIPASLDLARHLSLGAAASGSLIGLTYLLIPVGAFSAKALFSGRKQSAVRGVILTAAVCIILSVAVGTYALNPGITWAMSNRTQVVIIFSCRLSLGFFHGVVYALHSLVILQVTPHEEQVSLQMFRAIFQNMGIGCGPLFSSLMFSSFGRQGVLECTARQEEILAAMWLFVGVALWETVPSIVNADSAGKPSTLERAGLPQATAQQKTLDIDGKVSLADTSDDSALAKQQLWWLAQAFLIERALMISGLDCVTVMILQLKFGFSIRDAGLCLGLAFLLGGPVGLVFNSALQHDWISEGMLLKVLAIMCLIASPALSTGFCFYWWILMVGAAVMLITAWSSGGIVEGWANRNCMPGTFYSRENFIFVEAVGQNLIARFLAPASLRFIALNLGQQYYFYAQFLLCGMALLTAWKISRLRAIAEKHPDEAMAHSLASSSK